MNITRDLITDLLPIYFSGEASADTRALVEEYFRENPEFERIAKLAATPLEALRPVGRSAEEREIEKRALQRTRKEVRDRNVWRAFAIAWMLVPFTIVVINGHVAWLMIRDNPLQAGIFFVCSALCWIAYYVKGRKPDLSGL